MKIHIASDLHLRHHQAPLTLPGGEVLILAGDVFDGAATKGLTSEPAQFFLKELAKYEIVYFVAGNHEFYKSNFKDTYSALQQGLPGNVRILNDEWVSLGDYAVFGGTLWTDMDKDSPITKLNASRIMADHFLIQNDDGTKFSPDDSRALFSSTLKALKSGLLQKEKVLVVTHHAPSYGSVAQRYRTGPDSGLNGAFYSDLEYLFPQIKYWVHGHVHDKFDYFSKGCRILCNPRGYPHEKNDFSILEIDI